MTNEEFQREIFKLLGVCGPMGEVPEMADGQRVIFQCWRTPDGGEIKLEPPVTDGQRDAVIRRLKQHMGLMP